MVEDCALQRIDMFVIVDHFPHIFASPPPIKLFYWRILILDGVTFVTLHLFAALALNQSPCFHILFGRAIKLYPYEQSRDYRVCRYHNHQFVLLNSQWTEPQCVGISTNRRAPLSSLIIISQRLTTSQINSSQELQKQD